MSPKIPIVSSLIIILVAFVFNPSVFAQSSGPKTVLDYYLLLPNRFFEADQEQRVKWMLDSKRGAIVDLKNGYIFAPGDGAQMSLYVCLFKRPNEGPVVAVKSHFSDSDEHTFLDFYEYKDGSLVQLEHSVLPVKIHEEFEYKMPRYGRSIEVRNRSGRKIYTLVWFGKRFLRR